MTITNIIDRVVAWVDENICQQVTLKVPPEDPEAADGPGYIYDEQHPACFPLFVPGADKMPPNIHAPLPSICVRVTDGEDGRDIGTLTLELWFSAWNPGTHGRDILNPTGQSARYQEWNDEDADAYFQRNAEGWRDLWNWIDTALRALESAESIDGLPIDRDSGIKFGPAKEDGGIPDYYPFWFGYIGFTLKRPIVRNINTLDNFL